MSPASPASDPSLCGPTIRPSSGFQRLGAATVVALAILFALLAGAAPAAFALHVLSGAFGAPAFPAP